jgi:predicted DNA binding CopG/RHH family protein
MSTTSKKTKTKKKITYGKVDLLDEDEFAPENCKFRVTMFVSVPVLDEIRKLAKEKDLPYQVYINQVLRSHVFGDSDAERIRKIVREELKKESAA